MNFMRLSRSQNLSHLGISELGKENNSNGKSPSRKITLIFNEFPYALALFSVLLAIMLTHS